MRKITAINQKGFTGIEILGILAAGALVISVVLPALGIKVPGLAGNGQTTTQKEIHVTRSVPYVNPDTHEPVKILNKDGSTTVLMREETSNTTLDETIVPKAPLLERIVLWFVRAGFLGLVLALAFPAVAVALWAWIGSRWRKLREELDAHKEDLADLNDEAKRMVKGVDAALATIPASLAEIVLPGEVNRADLAKKIKDNILNTLSTSYDKSTKDLVRSLRDA